MIHAKPTPCSVLEFTLRNWRKFLYGGQAQVQASNLVLQQTSPKFFFFFFLFLVFQVGKHFYFFFHFLVKVRLDISCELSVRQT